MNQGGKAPAFRPGSITARWAGTVQLGMAQYGMAQYGSWGKARLDTAESGVAW